MTAPAYYCGFSSGPKQRGWTATVSLQGADDVWTELAEWKCRDMTSGERRRQARVVLEHHRGKPAPDFLIDNLLERPGHDLARIEVSELAAWLADFGKQLQLAI